VSGLLSFSICPFPRALPQSPVSFDSDRWIVIQRVQKSLRQKSSSIPWTFTGKEGVYFETLATEHLGLLKGGTSYVNVIAGVATEARYCAQTFALESFLKAANPIKVLLVLLFHLGKFLQILGLVFIELGLALIDFSRGIVEKKPLLHRLTLLE
jgi:hypothetical protein